MVLTNCVDSAFKRRFDININNKVKYFEKNVSFNVEKAYYYWVYIGIRRETKSETVALQLERIVQEYPVLRGASHEFRWGGR